MRGRKVVRCERGKEESERKENGREGEKDELVAE